MALTDAQAKAISEGYVVAEAGKPASIQRFYDTYNEFEVVGIKLSGQRMLVLLRAGDEIYPRLVHMQAHRFRYICEYENNDRKISSDEQLIADLQQLVEVGNEAAVTNTFL